MENVSILEGSYDCDCKKGFKFQDGKCMDVNECQTSKCGKGAVCINTVGSFECDCKKDNKIYDPILKKCKKTKCPKETCSPNGRCITKNGNYVCVCKPGFTGSKCELDLDECQMKNHPCQHECQNTYGGFKCSCQEGYDLKNKTQCQDVDECLKNQTICGSNGICINLPGSYRCQCEDGLSFDILQQKCIHNKCSKCSHSCGPDGECICPKGYILNSANNVECIKKRKKKKVQGCPPFNATEGIQLTYNKDFDAEINLYPRGTTIKGKCISGYKVQAKSKLKLKCKKDGRWKGTESLKCDLITCPMLENLESEGIVISPESCTQQDSKIKQKCLFSCADSKKFKLLGKFQN